MQPFRSSNSRSKFSLLLTPSVPSFSHNRSSALFDSLNLSSSLFDRPVSVGMLLCVSVPPSRGTQETMSSIFRCDPRPVHRGEITGTNTQYRRVAGPRAFTAFTHVAGPTGPDVPTYLRVSSPGAAFPEPRGDASRTPCCRETPDSVAFPRRRTCGSGSRLFFSFSSMRRCGRAIVCDPRVIYGGW